MPCTVTNAPFTGVLARSSKLGRVRRETRGLRDQTHRRSSIRSERSRPGWASLHRGWFRGSRVLTALSPRRALPGLVRWSTQRRGSWLRTAGTVRRGSSSRSRAPVMFRMPRSPDAQPTRRHPVAAPDCTREQTVYSRGKRRRKRIVPHRGTNRSRDTRFTTQTPPHRGGESVMLTWSPGAIPFIDRGHTRGGNRSDRSAALPG
jgi:hypothetical protein